MIIEFKKPVIDPATKLKIYRTKGSVLIELHNHKLLTHPLIVYDSFSKNLSIGLSPFIKFKDDGSLDVYSIALENTDKNFSTICNTCNYFTLDFTSFVAVDKVMGKMLKIFKVTPYTEVIVEDLAGHDLYIKALHPQHNHALFLSDKGDLGKIITTNPGKHIEVLHRCSKYSVNKHELFTVSVCIDNSIHTAVSSNIYGYNADLHFNHYLNDIDISKVYGYIKNNVYFVGFGRRGYVFKLKSICKLDQYYYEVKDLEPLAFIGNSELLAINFNKMLTLLNLDNNKLVVLNKMKTYNLVNYFSTSKHSYIATADKDYVYLYNVNEAPTYVKIRTGDVHIITLAKDKILLFKKDRIEVYEIDITSKYLHIEKLITIPKYFTYCITLEDNLILCVDRLGRIVISQIEKLLESTPMIKPLRSKSGSALYISNGFIPLTLNPVYENLLVKVRTHHYLLKTENTIDTHEVILPNIESRGSSYRINLEMPKDINNIRILRIDNKHLILRPNDGRDITAIERVYDKNVVQTISIDEIDKHSMKYVVKIYDNIEWGVKLNESNIVTLSIDEVLNYDQSKICLSWEKLRDMISSQSSLLLTAICSNTVMKGPCIDVSLCEKLLKLILEVDGRYVSLPIQQIVTPRIMFKNGNTKLITTYNQGVYEVLLPRRCVELKDVNFNMLESKILLQLNNRCQNVWGTIVMENSIFFVKPGSKKSFSIHVDFNDIVSDSGLQILIFESAGNISRYTLSIGIESILITAINIALKIAKILGVRNNTVKVFDNVHKNLRQIVDECLS